MNYWHIQLHPNNKAAYPPKKIKEILTSTSYIGMGQWDDGLGQINQFKNEVKCGDIVLVRSNGPLALVSVVGDHEFEQNPNKALDWFSNRRKVKLLKWFESDDQEALNTKTIDGIYAPITFAPANNSTFIKKWHQIVKNKIAMNNIKSLLEYKHQIILQGPPGTGKTRLAKIIAKDLVKPKAVGNPMDLIDNFFKTFDSNDPKVKTRREERKALLGEFQSNFPIDHLKDLTLEEYCTGSGDRNNFCWWLETGLKPLGRYSPGSSQSYLIYWSKQDGAYRKHGFLKNIDKDEIAVKEIGLLLSDTLKIKDIEKAAEYLGSSLLLKIFNSYFPDEFFPINGKDYLNNALKLFSINGRGMSKFEMNKKLVELFNAKKQQFNSDANASEFGSFLFSKFNLKTGDVIDNSQTLVSKGEYELVQFHPAYSYEDFVRGIVTSASERGIEYKTENRILADFAQKAIDNPNANYVLIIDEINRANLPAVLGELIYALEYRGEAVTSMYEYDQEREIILPKNLYIIGTMNTADRSVGHIDYAIRRRFSFVDVLPDISVISTNDGKGLFEAVQQIFQKHTSPDFRVDDVAIGHSYFLSENEKELDLKLEFEIKPILREYLKDGVLLEAAKKEIEELNV